MIRIFLIVAAVGFTFWWNDFWTAVKVYLIIGEIFMIVSLRRTPNRHRTILGTIFYIIYWAPVFIRLSYAQRKK